MKKSSIILYSLLLSVFLQSCDFFIKETITNPEEIYIVLKTEYINSENITRCSAGFYENNKAGFAVELKSPAHIKVNTMTMNYFQINELPYGQDFQCQEEEINFEYKDAEGKYYRNSLRLTEATPVFLSLEKDTFERSEDQVLEWLGTSLADDETLSFTIFNNNKSWSGDLIGTESHYFAMGSSIISQFIEGNTYLVLKRTRTFIPEYVPPSGGEMIIVYSTGPVKIYLK